MVRGKRIGDACDCRVFPLPWEHKGFPPPNPFLRIYRAPACRGAVFFCGRADRGNCNVTITGLDKAFARATAAAKSAGLPEVETGTSYGTPALKVRGKLFLRAKDADTLVVMCTLEEKELLMEAAPGIYFETDHYKGWPAVLVRASAISDAELAHRLARAWRLKAPKRLVAAFEAADAATATAKTSKRRSRS
jgi:hypothetical protein